MISSLQQGGTERVLVDLLRSLVTSASDDPYGSSERASDFDPFSREIPVRIRHAVVTLRDAGPLAVELPDSVACIAVGSRGASRSAAVTVARIVRRLRPAIIHARGIGCWADALAAKAANPRSRLVLGYHGSTEPTLGHRPRWLARAAAWANAHFVTVGESGRTQLQRQLGIGHDSVTVLPNGVDLGAYAHDATARIRLRQEFGWTDGEFVIGSVASLTPVKRHDLLIAAARIAMEQWPRIRLLLVGHGPLQPELTKQALVAGIADRIRFSGFRSDVSALLSSMDAYVCASDSECLSNSVLQALAVGLPIIAADVGDNSRVIRHGRDGMIVPPGSVEAIAASIGCLICASSGSDRPMTLNPSLGPSPTDGPVLSQFGRTLARSARRRAAEFDFSRTVKAYAQFYNTMTSPIETQPKPKAAATTHSLACSS